MKYLEDKVEDQRRIIESLEGKLKTLSNERDSLQLDISSLQTKVSTLDREGKEGKMLISQVSALKEQLILNA